MAYYFYKISNYNTEEEKVEKLYNCADDGLTFTEPQVEHENEVGDFIIVARNKQEAINTFIKFLYDEYMEEYYENYDGLFEPSWEEEMEEYLKNAHPDDLPYGGYPYF